LAGGVAIMLVLTIIQRGVGFGRSILFCRWLDADRLGEVDLAFNFLMLAAPLAVLGLPGSFGRYVDHFRHRGQLRSFLARVTSLSIGLSLIAIVILTLLRDRVGLWIFGRAESGQLMVLIAASLGAVIAFNFLNSLLTALRMYRANSQMQLVQTLLYAAVSVGLLWSWQAGAESVVIGFGAASLVTAVGAGFVIARVWRELPSATEALTYHSLTVKLAPFAFWLWVTNWVANSFEMVDRWMIIHYSGLDPVAALELVGQYHSARILPVLLIGIGDLLANMLTPHLSSDWEAGRREQVSQRLNFVLKLTGVGFTLASIGILWFSPLLFHFAFKHKFTGGESILSWALACAVWTAVSTITFNYLWCAEKSRWVSFTLGVGLSISAMFNLALLPTFGLLGAVWSTAIAKIGALTVLVLLVRRYGMQFDRRLLPVLVLPGLLPLGGWLTFLALVVVVTGVGRWGGCFTLDERRQIREQLTRVACRLPVLRRFASPVQV
jgi:O-antigen/teichoic acid export membrane protein